ncbi:MAG TPA: L,D-transpeptidase [Thermoanaerobaculia bacterium]|nr:L,D-transpeptidase [Thermoanaerobaculia bacterium]
MAPPGLPVEAPPVLPAGPPTRDRTYQLVTVPGSAKGLRERFTPEQLALLEKLNRRDVPHLARAEALIVPTEWLPDELLYSPLPGTWAESYSKALVVDQASQTFGGYELGRLVRWGPVSSGRKSRPTPSGLFHLNWRSKGRRSTDNPDWYMPWYFNFHAGRGLAFHQLELPGRPASHACVRLLERDAVWLYGWGKGWSFDEKRKAVPGTGTPVLILGSYDFDAPSPWLSLDWLARGIELPAQVEPAIALGR